MYNPKIVRGNVSLVMLDAQLRRAQMDWELAFNANQYTEADSIVDWMDELETQIKQLQNKVA